MEARIASYRRNRHTVTPHHLILTVPKVTSRDAAEKLIGKNVTFHTGKSLIHGKVVAAHGKSGAVRAIFEKGMPGQAIGKHVKIQ
ncbi:50S ribosomal protein L35ae [Candidatus Woesearchaeota archaeon]|nr:MAG: 50S ribosomal protein L35ae [Candidatus Woesearchaeota archaeon]